MRVVLPEPREIDDTDLPELYAAPTDWLRMNFVSTVDGAAWGKDGLSGSINNATDRSVFLLLRKLADAIVVGAGTAAKEGYGPAAKPLVLVSNAGNLPEKVGEHAILVTTTNAAGLAPSRERLGDDGVITLGDDAVDLTKLRPALAERGWTSLLCEGGPTLFGSMLHVGIVDELCLTQVPTVVGGGPGRIANGPAGWRSAELRLLLEADGTMLSRWLVS